jgi:diaminopimelate epimerase
MSVIRFWKYEGTGNDFIMLDNRQQTLHLSREQIEKMCHRRFGIGADGLILIENDSQSDFRMVYFNSDGRESTFCGNGGRCAAAFARFLGLAGEEVRFSARDGMHTARFQASGEVRLQMRDVSDIQQHPAGWVLFTGSPHLVVETDAAESLDVKQEGSRIRYSEPYKAEGINVNFVKKGAEEILVRTYERGVEDETLSCGTGVTAAALLASRRGYASPVSVRTPGGRLSVEFSEKTPGNFSDVWLIGPAVQVFAGEYVLPQPQA